MGFDADYYQRLYGDPGTRVHGAEEIARLATAITSMLDWFEIPLHRVLDVGAGTGLWGAWLRAHRPEVEVRSVDASEHACRTYGHEQRDIATWRDPAAEYDLVVCQGVLGYLDDEACAAAVANLAAMTRGVLYAMVHTEDDLRRGVVDRARTDLSIHVRPAQFYVDLFRDYYVPLGCGLWLIHTAPARLFALERAP